MAVKPAMREHNLPLTVNLFLIRMRKKERSSIARILNQTFMWHVRGPVFMSFLFCQI